MLREDSHKLLVKKKEEYNRQLAEKTRLEGTITALRAVTFIAGFCLIAIGLSEDNMLWCLGAAFLIGFILLVRIHNKHDSQVNRLKAGLSTVDKLLMGYEETWNQIEDDGGQFMEDEDYFAKDVDMLGFNSLYQKINLAHTSKGKMMLAKLLSLKEDVALTRETRQQAIKELCQDADFVVDFSSATKLLDNKKTKSDSLDEFAKYCGDKNVGALPGWAKVISIIFPVAFWVAFILWLCDVTHYGYALVIFFVNLSVNILTRHVTDRIIQPVYVMCILFENYMQVLKVVSGKEFKSERLKELHHRLCGEDGTYTAFNKLKGISQAYNISYNPVIHQVFASVFFWDYQLARAVGNWKEKYGANVADCFDNIGELEALISLASIGITHQCCWGELSFDDKVSLKVEDAYHPLIDQSKVVSNSATLEDGITIITGSNMSGKTTFLRTLAINLALLYIGAPVCAKEFKSSYMKIFTSMRVTDDVAHGISTFYAEILRIKTMSEYKKCGKPMLCLIDEIFKGTNSADRIVGAKGVITGLSGENTMVIVSTHDFELCSLTNQSGEQVANYHFEEYYQDDMLKFDYSIKDGRCTTTNAKAILKMAGFSV
ncbi:MAG: DNA mismatch repair protein MutS [Lachnospiraceae bacterium]|nr:DNA mismatch repair protein MutS [Lachnospiraceae bacterium]